MNIGAFFDSMRFLSKPVAAVYNKAQKLTERAAALDAWVAMVTGRPTNIIKLREE